MEFQQDWPKDKKNYSSFSFLARNLEKFRSTEHLGAPLEGSTIFLLQLFGQYGNGKLSITGVEICNFQQGRA